MTKPIHALAFIAALAAFPASAQEVLRAQTALPTQHTLSQSFIKHFVDVINAENGAARVNMLGGPEVNPQDRAVAALDRGLLDILWIPAAFTTGTIPEAQAMMLQNIGIDELRANGSFDHFAGIFEEKANAHFLAWSETSAGYYLYLTRQPAMTEEGVVDLTGLSMRSTGAYRPIIEALNGTPVAIPAGDVPQGLDRGVINGFGWPTVGLESIGLQDSVNYRVEPQFYNLANIVLVNKNKWASLSDEAREQLSRVALSYEQASIEEMNVMGEADIAAGDAAGIQPIRMEGDAAARYLSTAFDAMWGNVGRNVGDEITEQLRGMIYRDN
jgi:TRAP-type C4-dicarboxylate transport system substrate-binding protein